MISYRFKRILAVWLFVPLSFINAAAGMSPVIGAQAAPRMELSPAGEMLYKYAFPEKLSYVGEKGTIAATTLGQAVLCFANEPMRGTPVESGVINNIGLLDLIATKMTEKMALNVGRAAYAYESIALKTVNEVHRKQESIRSLTPQDIQVFSKLLQKAAAYEEGFLGSINENKALDDIYVQFSQTLRPFLESLLPGLIMKYNEKYMEKLGWAGGNIAKDKFVVPALKAFSRNAANESSQVVQETTAISGITEAQAAEIRRIQAGFLAKTSSSLQQIYDDIGGKDPHPDVDLNDPKGLVLALASIYLPIILPGVLGQPGQSTEFTKKLDSAVNAFQDNVLKKSPALFTAWFYGRDLINLANLGGIYLSSSISLKMTTPMMSTFMSGEILEGFKIANKILPIGMIGYQAYSIIKTINERQSALKKVRDSLIPAAHFLCVVNALHTALEKNKTLWDLLPLHVQRSFTGFFSQPETVELAKLAATSTFKDNSGKFFAVGNCARFIQLFKKQEKELKGLAQGVGYIDYLTTLAQYVAPEGAAVNERGQTIAFSYANFVEDEKPYLMANDLWYPAYDSNKVVATSVKLGGGDPAQHMLITGVNGCGKSIVMSAMMAAVVMAHTHGIVAARENALTPFDYVIFHGNIADEKGAGLSKGVKEMFACSNIIKQVRDAANADVADLARDVSQVSDVIERTRGLKGRIYLTFDELFSSTDPLSAERLSSVVIRSLIKNPNLMMVATTHNRGLTQLAEQTKGLVKNAYVETDFNETTGEIKYQRQLVSGVNHSMPALFIMKDKLRNAGNVDPEVMAIIDQAIEEQRREGGFVAKA